jgi:hypothetical protein
MKLNLQEDLKGPLVEGLRFQVERTSESYASRQLADLRLSPDKVELFWQKCGSMMQQYDGCSMIRSRA